MILIVCLVGYNFMINTTNYLCVEYCVVILNLGSCLGNHYSIYYNSDNLVSSIDIVSHTYHSGVHISWLSSLSKLSNFSCHDFTNTLAPAGLIKLIKVIKVSEAVITYIIFIAVRY
jgi:hypothetical protein